MAHFERLVAQLRSDVAAFSGVTGETDQSGLTPEARRAAENAVHRVAGVLAFLANSSDPLAVELHDLHHAVSPVVLAAATTS